MRPKGALLLVLTLYVQVHFLLHRASVGMLARVSGMGLSFQAGMTVPTDEQAYLVLSMSWCCLFDRHYDAYDALLSI
jgi:hypothetical protein